MTFDLIEGKRWRLTSGFRVGLHNAITIAHDELDALSQLGRSTIDTILYARAVHLLLDGRRRVRDGLECAGLAQLATGVGDRVADPLAFFESSSVTFLARWDLLASSRTSPTRSLMAPSCSFSMLDDFCASDSTMLNFCRADFRASDSSSFWASSRNFRILSLISLFLSISAFMLSKNCEKKPALRPGAL